MAKKRKEPLYITQDYLDQCLGTLDEFEAVRKESLVRYIEITLKLDPDLAEKVVETMLRRKHIITAKYAGTTVVKTSEQVPAKSKFMDAFDAYLAVSVQEQLEKDNLAIFATRAKFPLDFTLYTSSGRLYSVFIYDAHLAQKMTIAEGKRIKARDHVTLVVLPVGTNPETVKIPVISGKYRLAIVRKSKSGKTLCYVTEIAENTKQQAQQ